MLNSCSQAMLAIERVLRTVAAACLLAVMLLVFCDVLARYLFQSPLIVTYELVGMYLMPAIFYFALSDTLADHHHIAVDLLVPRIPAPTRRVIEALASALMATLFVWIVWIFAPSALANFRGNAVVMGALEWPTWIPDAIVVIGATTMAMRLYGRAVAHLASLVTGKSLIGLPPSAGY